MNDGLVEKIRKIRSAFEKRNVMELRVISNELIEEAALKNDQLLAEISILAYSLHKTLSKPHIVKHETWEKAKNRILVAIKQAVEMLESNDLKGFKKKMDSVSESVASVDEYLGRYIQSVHDKAKVKQASRAYAMGLSLSSAAELTGADKKNVLEYIGKTNIHDREGEGIKMKKRMEKLREVFG